MVRRLQQAQPVPLALQLQLLARQLQVLLPQQVLA
ncbi:unnamed protein product, partial [Adineta steineri]